VKLVRENHIDVDVKIILKSSWTDTQEFFRNFLPESFYFFLSLYSDKKKVNLCMRYAINFYGKKKFLVVTLELCNDIGSNWVEEGFLNFE
jgi:hypothetical protein